MIKPVIKIFIVLTMGLTVAVSGCNRAPESSRTKAPTTDQLAEINREMVIKERERIESYIKRKNLDMSCTETGLWYSITLPGSGEVAVPGKRVVIDYECRLLDGTLCYTGEKDGFLEIIPGRSDVPPGLDEGVRMLNEGSEATFILPSYLAYGLTGDRKKIPAHATLVYKVNVVGIY